MTGSSSLKGDGLLIAQEISRRMKSELGITVSVSRYYWDRFYNHKEESEISKLVPVKKKSR